MENHRRLWHRFVSRLRSSRKTHSYVPRSVTDVRNAASSTVAVDAFFPGRYSRIGRDHVRTRPRLHIASQNDWNFANSFTRLGHLDKLVSFTPKCLTGFNAQHLLSGQVSYDDFSHNCWLEDHLHRFGGIQTDVLSNENNSVTDSDNDAQVSSENISIASSSHNEMSVPATVDIWNNISTPDINIISSQSGSNLSSNTTVSDITHFYLAGFAFHSDSIFSEPPPPYSELQNDPPPPYTELLQDSIRNRSENNRTSNSSYNRLHFHDILW